MRFLQDTLKRARVRGTVAVLVLMSTAASIYAQENAVANQSTQTRVEPDSVGEPLWEAGVLGTGVLQPAYPGAAEQVNLLLPLPYMIYRGKYLRIDRGTVGVRAIKTPRTELDVGFAASLGSRADNIEVRRGMDDLGILLEFGPRLKINLGDMSEGIQQSRIQFALRGVFDINDHLSYHGMAFEPAWVNEITIPESWATTISIGAVLGNLQLVDTFYRVTPTEATATRPAYNAHSGLISTRASILSSRMINRDLRFFGYLRFDSVVGAANHDSPLVKRDNGWSAAIGLMWTLARSQQGAND